MAEFQCRVCDADGLETLDAFAQIARVTSDCKPWPAGGKMAVCHRCGAIQKLPDAAWFADIESIYKGYQIYELSGGAEQVIFSGDGQGAPRSHRLVDFIKQTAALPPRGKLIDIGCGNGGALRTFSGALPDWKLFGSELTDAAAPSLRMLPNFVDLFTVEPADIKDRFDLVSMIHSLEHMPEPSKTLRDAAGLMTASGVLFVEVPDAETSPFDLIVADHLVHFSPATLRLLAERNGLSVQVLRNDFLPKENTMLARRGATTVAKPDPAAGVALARRNIAWLGAVMDKAAAAAAGGKPFGLFGTSISGTWLYGALRDKIKFFVDEDVTRVGQSVEGRPIVAPSAIPKDGVVFVPLIPSVADKVIARLSVAGAQFVGPPPFGA